jgi:hypothetical protein
MLDIYSFEKWLHKFLRLPPAPYALPVKEFCNKGDYTWDDWKHDMKTKYRFRWFLVHFIPDAIVFFQGIYRRTLGEVFYWIRTHTYNRYHIVNLKQPKDSPGDYEYHWGWLDRSRALIFANFAILCDFVENEDLPAHRWHWDKETDKTTVVKKTWQEVLAEYEEILATDFNKDDPKWKYDDGSFKDNEYEQHLVDIKAQIELYTIYKWWKVDRFDLCKKIDETLPELNYARRNNHEEYDKRLNEWVEAEKELKKQEEDILIRLIKIRNHLWT